MSDLLVRLYDLPPLAPAVADAGGAGDRRCAARSRRERPQVTQFAREHGSEGWAAECEAAFARVPLACFVAAERNADETQTLIGFACYEATCRNFFGPELVHPDGARARHRQGAAAGGAARDARRRVRLRDHRLGVVGRLLSQGGRRHRDRGLGAGHLPAPPLKTLTAGVGR